MAGSNTTPADNLAIWDQIVETPTQFVKPYKGMGGAQLKSVNAEYRWKRMTELFGPIGVGWGFEVRHREIIEGGPLTRGKGEQETIVATAQVHTVRVRVWYIWNGERREVDGVGHTPFVFANQYGVQTDWDYEKKSITDALSNAMRYLGLAGDVFMGFFDVPGYVESRQLEERIEAAGDDEVKQAEMRHEFEDWYATHMKVLGECHDIRTLEITYKGGRERVEIQGTDEQKQAHFEAKNARARELMQKQNKQENSDDSSE